MKCLGPRIEEETLSLLQNNLLALVLFLPGITPPAEKTNEFCCGCIQSSKLAKAQTISPTLYRKAEFYSKAKVATKKRIFDKAKQYAELL